MTSGTGTCSVRYDQAGNANYNAAPQVTETVNAQKAGPDDHRDHARAGERGLQHELRVAANAPGGVGQLLERRRLLEHRRDLHDDERHRHLLGQVRPGRRRELQRRAAGHRDGQRAEGEPDDHVTTHAPASAVFNTSFGVAATRRRLGQRGHLLQQRAPARTPATRSR